MPRTERLAFLLGLVVVGLALSHYLPLPSPVLAYRLPGAPSPFGITLAPGWQVGLVVALLTCGLLDLIMRDDPLLAGAGVARTAPYWVLPAALVLAAFQLCEGLAGAAAQALGMAGAAAAVGVVVVAQLHTLDAGDRWFAPARLGLNTLTYGLALGAYYLVEALPERALLAVPLVALCTATLTLPLLAGPASGPRRTWGSSALVGLMLAEVAWALGAGSVRPLVAGFVLLLVFYSFTGVLQQHHWGRLRRAVVAEFASVTLAVLALVLIVAR